mgnify:CR=1 FL=1
MALSYRPLWVSMAKKQLSKTEVTEMAHISTNVMANMGKNEGISLKNLERICTALDLTPNEVIEFVPKDQVKNNQR